MPEIKITPLSDTPEIRAMLTALLVEAVAHGASVSFMHPLAPDIAADFWADSLAAALRGERVILGAFDEADLVGTVTMRIDCPPNQPHRAEIAKLMTKVSHRGRGVAKALMRALEPMALERGRNLLVLDTASDGGAAALYAGLGFVFAGEIPDYALKPHGGLTATRIYWKRLACPKANAG